MTHFQKFMREAQDNGYSYEDALNDPRAKEAARRDDAAAKAAHLHKSKAEYLAAFKESRRQQGSNHAGFVDGEELQLAMADPAYDTNPEYRAAVEEILAQTPGDALGISASDKGNGQTITIGNAYSTETATVESMKENAYREMVMDEIGKLDLNTPRGRYTYLEYLTNPANKFLVEYQESLVTTPEHRTHQSMIESRASGQRDEITIGAVPNDGSEYVPDGQEGGQS